MTALLLVGEALMIRSKTITRPNKQWKKRPPLPGAAIAVAAALLVGPIGVPAHADQSGSRAFNNWDYIDINTGYYEDVMARDAAGDLWVYPGDGRGGWKKKPRFKMGQGWNTMTAIVGPGHFQSEFWDDLLARDTTGALWLYLAAGGQCKPRVHVGVGWNVMTAMVGPGDFDGDRRVDLMARDREGRLWLYPGDGRGGWLPRSQVGEGWNVMTALIGRGDFNEDGKTDLLARDANGRLWLYPGNGAGGWLPRMQVGEGWNAMTSIIATGRFDINYAGYSQIIARDTNGILWLYPGIGSRHLEPRKQIGEGWNVMNALV
ncbi:VCBS repeat-containing protein [Paenarthrobacter sp. NPDC089322]|uniref:FG-GAP repeat domain-containing protein n=1 Tax=Paenarthrobacter sp. NPDC089322 TaxID=3155065 RepID=UPI0034255681